MNGFLRYISTHRILFGRREFILSLMVHWLTNYTWLSIAKSCQHVLWRLSIARGDGPSAGGVSHMIYILSLISISNSILSGHLRSHFFHFEYYIQISKITAYNYQTSYCHLFNQSHSLIIASTHIRWSSIIVFKLNYKQLRTICWKYILIIPSSFTCHIHLHHFLRLAFHIHFNDEPRDRDIHETAETK